MRGLAIGYLCYRACRVAVCHVAVVDTAKDLRFRLRLAMIASGIWQESNLQSLTGTSFLASVMTSFTSNAFGLFVSV